MGPAAIRSLQSPSVLKRIKHPGWEECALENFQPRLVDEGRPSFWRYGTQEQKTLILAGLAAKRDRIGKLCVLCLGEAVFRHAKIDLEPDPATNSFSCIADLHRSAMLADEAVRKRLVDALRTFFNTEEVQFEDKKETQVRAMLIESAKGCPSEEIRKAKPWAQELVRSTTS